MISGSSACTPRLIFDVTLTLAWRGKIVTGIPRVEAEVASALLRRQDPSILFCSYRAKIDVLQVIPHETVRKVLALQRLEPVPHRAPRPQRGKRRLVKWLEMVWRRYLFPPANQIRLRPSDTYVALGAWWNTFGADKSRFARLKSDARVLVMCHDIIPALFPDFFEDRAAEKIFRNALPMFSAADAVICNSQATAKDLSNLLAASGLPIPVLVPLRFPPGLTATQVVPQLPLNMPVGRFVLCVGSISRRKNQSLLFDVWSRFEDDAALRDVTLIIAGTWDQHSDPIQQRLRDDTRLGQRVVILDRTTDRELAWLYSHCLFTVYPSHYEGRGMPIDESLSFGKLCVASNTSAMPEVGQGLCLHLSPQDAEPWYQAIRQLVFEPSKLTEYEAKIKQSYRPAIWDDAGAIIVEASRTSIPT